MGKLINIVGRTFNDLTVIKQVPNSLSICLCVCGKTTKTQTRHLKTGHTKSCGCLLHRVNHGDSGIQFHTAWMSMKARVKSNSKKTSYKDKGIIVCERWQEYKNFKNDMFSSYLQHLDIYGGTNTTLDREDNSKGYYPKNCRWATKKEQINNRG